MAVTICTILTIPWCVTHVAWLLIWIGVILPRLRFLWVTKSISRGHFKSLRGHKSDWNTTFVSRIFCGSWRPRRKCCGCVLHKRWNLCGLASFRCTWLVIRLKAVETFQHNLRDSVIGFAQGSEYSLRCRLLLSVPSLWLELPSIKSLKTTVNPLR